MPTVLDTFACVGIWNLIERVKLFFDPLLPANSACPPFGAQIFLNILE
jgi:hypothetical protein